MNWKFSNVKYEDIENLSKKLNIPPILIKICLNRNKTENEIISFFSNINQNFINANKLYNANKVADKIIECLKLNKLIYLFPDYDSDGLNSVYIFYNALKAARSKLNSKSEIIIRHSKRNEGYGISIEFVEDILNKNNENILVITLDNGISKIEEINTLIDNNIDVIVVDHHESLAIVPNCLICDPHNNTIEQPSDFKHLCGAGVAFKVCEILERKLGFYDMEKFIYNVAIATITDMMPLVNENIAFIIKGISQLNNQICPTFISYYKAFLNIDNITPVNIGWDIGPRINVCSRLNNTELGYKFISNNDYFDMYDIVNDVETLNDTKKEIVKSLINDIKKYDFNDTLMPIVIIPDNIPHGILSIIANKVLNLFNKPCVVAMHNKDTGICTGSARSIEGINLLDLFSNELLKDNILNYGGHERACGISFYYDKIEKLQEDLNISIIEILEEIKKLMLKSNIDIEEPYLKIDEYITINDLNSNIYNIINYLPYGDKFEKPIFCLDKCNVISAYPTKSNPNNLWLELSQCGKYIKLWCENMTSIYESLNNKNKISIVGYIEKNFMENGNPYIIKPIDIKSCN